MQIDINNEDLFAITCLVYEEWSDKFKVLKNIKAEKNDGSPDWELFHRIRLSSAIPEETKWKNILDKLKAKVKALGIFPYENS